MRAWKRIGGSKREIALHTSGDKGNEKQANANLANILAQAMLELFPL